MLRVVKVRLYPNKEQQTLIHKTFWLFVDLYIKNVRF